jgi:hypothetical protein
MDLNRQLMVCWNVSASGRQPTGNDIPSGIPHQLPLAQQEYLHLVTAPPARW